VHSAPGGDVSRDRRSCDQGTDARLYSPQQIKQCCLIENISIAVYGKMSSLEKGLKALRLLSETRRQLRVSEVAFELRLPASSASRLLKILEAQGLLVHLGRNDGYEAGPELRRLASLRGDELDQLLKAAGGHLRKIVQSHPVTGYLTTLQGTDALIVQCVESTSPIRFIASEGSMIPAFATAAGKALLMRTDPRQVRKFLPTLLTYPPLRYRMTRDRLLTELDISRLRRWTKLNDSADRGIEAIASAVRSTDGHMVGIALCYLQDDVSAKEFERLLSLLLACCEDIGARFSDGFWTRTQSG